MNSLITKQTKPNIKSAACPLGLNWVDNPDVQKLLDVISEIIANEYIEIAKKNKGVFEIASGTSCLRNDEREDISHNDVEQNGGKR